MRIVLLCERLPQELGAEGAKGRLREELGDKLVAVRLVHLQHAERVAPLAHNGQDAIAGAAYRAAQRYLQIVTAAVRCHITTVAVVVVVACVAAASGAACAATAATAARAAIAVIIWIGVGCVVTTTTAAVSCGGGDRGAAAAAVGVSTTAVIYCCGGGGGGVAALLLHLITRLSY